MIQYRGMRWQDSDIFDVYIEKAKAAAKVELDKDRDEIRKEIKKQEPAESHRLFSYSSTTYSAVSASIRAPSTTVIARPSGTYSSYST